VKTIQQSAQKFQPVPIAPLNLINLLDRETLDQDLYQMLTIIIMMKAVHPGTNNQQRVKITKLIHHNQKSQHKVQTVQKIIADLQLLT